MTVYLLRWGRVYLVDHPSNGHWTTDADKARRFQFQTSVNAVAMLHLNLSTTEYVIEPFDVKE